MNLANRITVLRILMVPFFLWVFFADTNDNANLWAAVVFVAATLTDGLDGYIARTRRQVTTLGKFMDPLADKMLISAALIALVERGVLPAWIVVVIVAREFAVTGLRGIVAAEGVVIPASIFGKIKTFIQSLAITVLLLQDIPQLQNIISYDIMHTTGIVMIYCALFFTLYSGIDYILRCLPLLLSDRANKPPQ